MANWVRLHLMGRGILSMSRIHVIQDWSGIRDVIVTSLEMAEVARSMAHEILQRHDAIQI